MEFADVVARRRMVRAYDGRAVDDAAVQRIVDSALRGPSAGFSQGVAFVVVTDADTRAAVTRVCGEEDAVARGLPRWVSTAPALVVPCVRPGDYVARYAEADKSRSRGPAEWGVPWWWVDAGAALMLLLLAAVNEGLAAGLLDVSDRDSLRAALDIPSDVVPLGVVTVGHPAADRRSSSLRRGRRPRSETMHRNRWST